MPKKPSKPEPVTGVKVGGIWYDITVLPDARLVSHSEPRPLWGELDFERQSIRIRDCSLERKNRTLWHEVIHAIVDAYSIRELEQGDSHAESAIDQLAYGIAEALESMGLVLPMVTFRDDEP